MKKNSKTDLMGMAMILEAGNLIGRVLKPSRYIALDLSYEFNTNPINKCILNVHEISYVAEHPELGDVVRISMISGETFYCEIGSDSHKALKARLVRPSQDDVSMKPERGESGGIVRPGAHGNAESPDWDKLV